MAPSTVVLHVEVWKSEVFTNPLSLNLRESSNADLIPTWLYHPDTITQVKDLFKYIMLD